LRFHACMHDIQGQKSIHTPAHSPKGDRMMSLDLVKRR